MIKGMTSKQLLLLLGVVVLIGIVFMSQSTTTSASSGTSSTPSAPSNIVSPVTPPSPNIVSPVVPPKPTPIIVAPPTPTTQVSWVQSNEDPNKSTGGMHTGANRMMYSCRAPYGDGIYAGGVHPGKTWGTSAGCAIGWGGMEIVVPPPVEMIQISGPYKWSKDKSQGTPVQAGKEADGTPLFICRLKTEDGIHPGKTRNDWGNCHVGWGGTERSGTDFEYLLV